MLIFPILSMLFPIIKIIGGSIKYLCRHIIQQILMRRLLLSSFLISSFFQASAQFRTPAQQQILTNEDSLQNGIAKTKTIISGYGSAFYQSNANDKTATMGLDRAVLFVGHQFNKRIAFFSELEVENAVASSGAKGEVSMEQAFLKFNLNQHQYIVAGLFIPRIGIINENHLPVNFNGVERPIVETIIIPATWREVGIGFYGSSNQLPLNYSIGLMNGLNGQDFTHGTGLLEGRAEGSMANAGNLALTGALQYHVGHFKFQVSGYMGGTIGLRRRAADSLALNSGSFGTPIYLGEANIQWAADGFSAKALGTFINYPEADKINQAFASNIAQSIYGAYAEFAYNWLHVRSKKRQFVTFARYELLDLNATIPGNGLYDGTLKQNHLIVGASYLPIPNVVLKADVRLLNTGDQNPALLINPSPNALPYQKTNTFINLGIGYSF
jgi:hypothetical protein